MSDHPMIFNGPMVRAILDGSKTQTRRIMPRITGSLFPYAMPIYRGGKRAGSALFTNPGVDNQPGEVGDLIWVRESVKAIELPSGLDVVQYTADGAEIPIQDTADAADKWGAMSHYGGKDQSALVPSIHMPRWASRLTLTVTDVRVQRVQDISNADAADEGVGGLREYDRDAADTFSRLWNRTYKKRGRGWCVNPWVAAYSFTVERGNIDRAR